jgi:hypothetical protein
MAKTPTHDELNRLVEACQEILVGAWSKRRNEDDILCLGDLDRQDVGPPARQFWKSVGDLVPPTIMVRVGAIGGTFVAYLQPAQLIDAMERSRVFDLQQAAEELRGFDASRPFGIVPLLVVLRGGFWATQWAPPDSGAAVIRYDPGPGPDRN